MRSGDIIIWWVTYRDQPPSQGVKLEILAKVGQACTHFLWFFFIAKRAPKRVDGVLISGLYENRNIGLPKPNLVRPLRVLYITRQILRFSRPCFLVIIHEIRYFRDCMYCSRKYLRVEKNFISEFKIEHFITLWKTPKLGLILYKFYVSHPTVEAAK